MLAYRCRKSRDSRWDHHLKGLLGCARCAGRLHLEVCRNRHGWRYPYFVCSGRQPRTCDLPRLPLRAVESAVDAHWTPAVFGADEKTAISDELHRRTRTRQVAVDDLRRQLRSERTRLNRIEDQCLELLGQPGWPLDKLTEHLALVRKRRTGITQRLDELNQRDRKAGIDGDLVSAMVESLDRPRELFRRLPPTLRKTLGQLRFEKFILNVRNPGKEFIGPAQPGNRGGTPATRVDIDDLLSPQNYAQI